MLLVIMMVMMRRGLMYSCGELHWPPYTALMNVYVVTVGIVMMMRVMMGSVG